MKDFYNVGKDSDVKGRFSEGETFKILCIIIRVCCFLCVNNSNVLSCGNSYLGGMKEKERKRGKMSGVTKVKGLFIPSISLISDRESYLGSHTYV